MKNYYQDGTFGVLIGGETLPVNSHQIDEASSDQLAENPPAATAPKKGMMPETKTPAQVVVEDTPGSCEHEENSKVKISESVDASSSSTSPINRQRSHSSNRGVFVWLRLEPGRSRFQIRYKRYYFHHSFAPPRSCSMRAGEVYN